VKGYSSSQVIVGLGLGGVTQAGSKWFSAYLGLRELNRKLISTFSSLRGYHTAFFISTHISRSSVDYQPEAIAEG